VRARWRNRPIFRNLATMAIRMSLGRWAAAISLGLIAFFAVSAFVWRDDILRTWLDPKQPFQTYRPPPAPDYAQPAAWALIPARPELWSTADPPADVFFIHPTTFDGGHDWNGPIDDRRAARGLTEVMLPNYAGAFQKVGRVFAPRYRQASLYAFTTNKEDAQEARRFAYGDVHRAFDTFLTRYNDGRPIVLVGVEQGGGLAARLADDLAARYPKVLTRLAAVYLIDAIVPAENYGATTRIPACRDRGEAGCVVAWEQAGEGEEAAQLSKRALVWSANGALENLNGRTPLCVNPILGAVGSAFAPIRLNLGAANASGLEWGVRPAFLPRQVSAQCIDGYLRVSKPLSLSLKTPGSWIDRLKAPPFNLFYADEEADAKARVATLIRAPGYKAPTPPIGASIVVPHSPVHRIS
jgi:hypothetical protein